MPAQQFAQDWEAFAQLSYDVLQLTALLMLTGGLQNPFIVMLAAPVTIAVAALPQRWALGVAVIAMGGTGMMWLWSLPLPWAAGEAIHLPDMYVFGLWCAIFIAVAFTAVYSWRVSQEGRRMATALAATQTLDFGSAARRWVRLGSGLGSVMTHPRPHRHPATIP